MIGGVDTAGEGKAEKFKVTFNLTPAEATLVVKDLQGELRQPTENNNVYELEAGIYIYSASAEGYIEKEETRIEIYQEMTIDVELQRSLEIVPFSTATDEQLEKMLNAHYNGEINIEDYWKVGDTRVVQLSNLGSSGTKSHVNQKMTMVILDFNHDDLVEPIGSKDKAAVTIQCREILGNNGTEEDEYYWGKSYTPVKDTDNYTVSPLRTWLNGAFISAMPSTFGTLVKTVNKKNLAKHTTSSGAPVNSEDKAFLLSYPEVFGTTKYSYYLNNGNVGTYEGTQYEYYQTSANRIKKPNNNGSKGSNPGFWWLRSPSSNSYSSNGYTWCIVIDDGTADMNFGNGTYGLAPAFCL